MPSFLHPSYTIRGKAGGLQILRCQGFAVGYDGVTLGRLGSEALRLLQRWGLQAETGHHRANHDHTEPDDLIKVSKSGAGHLDLEP
jgi:hypothetical protein